MTPISAVCCVCSEGKLCITLEGRKVFVELGHIITVVIAITLTVGERERGPPLSPSDPFFVVSAEPPHPPGTDTTKCPTHAEPGSLPHGARRVPLSLGVKFRAFFLRVGIVLVGNDGVEVRHEEGFVGFELKFGDKDEKFHGFSIWCRSFLFFLHRLPQFRSERRNISDALKDLKNWLVWKVSSVMNSSKAS
ncbi:hypothetical protein OPV22_001760 [Ensete ventricosum]|uniref:Uncharacterized protein n=1 Tax=Ensete ventricosum TaxID=4639 RepID=A0AAV8QD96_ENSVE|nr:hypothetical protein OPV22_001760 [Ensete ventricosum]